MLKSQLKDFDKLKLRVNELEEVAKVTSRSNKEPQRANLTVNYNETYSSLQKLLEERAKSRQQEKLTEAINKLTGK